MCCEHRLLAARAPRRLLTARAPCASLWQNELIVARERDTVWWKDNARFTLAPVSTTGRPGRVADPNDWADFIRKPCRSNAHLATYELGVVPRVRADVAGVGD